MGSKYPNSPNKTIYTNYWEQNQISNDRMERDVVATIESRHEEL